MPFGKVLDSVMDNHIVVAGGFVGMFVVLTCISFLLKSKSNRMNDRRP